MLQVITNDSGDYLVVKDNSTNEILFEGHSLKATDLAYLLDGIHHDGCMLSHIPDSQMEEGKY